MASMKWKDIAELVGLAALVASIVTVAYEMRQTQEALVAATYQARAFDAIAESNFFADSEYLMPILASTDNAKNIESYADLSEIDRLRLRSFFRARMIDWDNEYYQYQRGFLDEDFFETTTRPAVIEWAPRWRALGLTESRREFRAFVDASLSDKQAEPQE